MNRAVEPASKVTRLAAGAMADEISVVESDMKLFLAAHATSRAPG